MLGRESSLLKSRNRRAKKQRCVSTVCSQENSGVTGKMGSVLSCLVLPDLYTSNTEWGRFLPFCSLPRSHHYPRYAWSPPQSRQHWASTRRPLEARKTQLVPDWITASAKAQTMRLPLWTWVLGVLALIQQFRPKPRREERACYFKAAIPYGPGNTRQGLWFHSTDSAHPLQKLKEGLHHMHKLYMGAPGSTPGTACALEHSGMWNPPAPNY